MAVFASSNSKPARGSPAQGFTLLEVLVAFVILVVAMAAFMRLFSGGLGGIESSRRHAMASLIARSVLERIGVELPVTATEYSGDAGGEFVWRADLRPFDAARPVAAGGAALYVPYEVTVAVAWRDRPMVVLKTLRLAATSGATEAGSGKTAEPTP